jgi:two-component system CitB family sensor kinase
VVADNGPGIAPEALGELWKEGYTRGKRGSGLGLAVVRELALSAGGSVDAGSAHGGGARFTVAIPCLGSDGREPPRSA